MADYSDFFGGSIQTALPTDKTVTFYADNVATCVFTQYVVKMQFIRSDALVSTQQGYVSSISGQITIPVDGFLNAYLFMIQKIEEMKVAGIITDKMIEDRKSFGL